MLLIFTVLHDDEKYYNSLQPVWVNNWKVSDVDVHFYLSIFKTIGTYYCYAANYFHAVDRGGFFSITYAETTKKGKEMMP